MPFGGLLIGSAALGAGSSVAGGKKAAKGASSAAAAQLQSTRESIAAQERMANKGFGVLQRESALARKDLEPLREIGLQNLQMASGFADPNSAFAQQERDVFARTLARNLASRGLTGSGTEIAGLSDHELGLARERRNTALGLAGVGANTLQSLAGIRSNLGNQGASIFSGLGSSMGSTIAQGGQNLANLQMMRNQALSQGLIGAGNAFQTGIGGIAQMHMYNQNQELMKSLLGGGSSYSPLFPGAGTF